MEATVTLEPWKQPRAEHAQLRVTIRNNHKLRDEITRRAQKESEDRTRAQCHDARPANRELAELAVERFYGAVIGLGSPGKYVWCDSPSEMGAIAEVHRSKLPLGALVLLLARRACFASRPDSLRAVSLFWEATFRDQVKLSAKFADLDLRSAAQIMEYEEERERAIRNEWELPEPMLTTLTAQDALVTQFEAAGIERSMEFKYCLEDVRPPGCLLADIFDHCGAVLFLPGMPVLCERPLWMRPNVGPEHLDLQRPTMVFRNGEVVYDYRGRPIDRVLKARMDLGNLSPREVLDLPDPDLRRLVLEDRGGWRWVARTWGAQAVRKITNVELRDNLINAYPVQDFVLACRPNVRSDRFGTLYSVETAEGDAVSVVRVTNRTPNPDGTFSDYWLRVPPWMTTAKEAVAWTFGMEAEEYAPEQET